MKRQFLRFCLVGAFATALDAGLFYLLRLWMPYRAAMMIAYLTSLCINTLLTLRWTFGTAVDLRNGAGVVLAHLFNLFVVRYGLMSLFIALLHMSDKSAFLPTLSISVLTNYLIIKTIIRTS